MFLENKEKTRAHFQCESYDNDTLQISVEDFGDGKEIYIHTLSDNFFTLQQETFFKRLERKLNLCLSILLGREYRLFEIVITNEDVNKFKEFVKNI
jgi:hypothetical protein